jgi:hypothetical protein
MERWERAWNCEPFVVPSAAKRTSNFTRFLPHSLPLNVNYETHHTTDSSQDEEEEEDDNPVQFNSYLFTCELNSPEANYKVSSSKKNETTTKHLQTKYKIRQFI